MWSIRKCEPNDYPVLVDIWERSVRASHDFLTERVINEIKEALIPEYFPAVELYAVDSNGCMTGFVGIAGDKMEMLFVDSRWKNCGYGSALIEFAKLHGVTKVDVNEQNPAAIEFYKSRGFHFVGRDETDEAGRFYPIVHMSL